MNLVSILKRSLFFAFLLCLASLAFFWREAAVCGLSYKAKSYCKHALGGELSYESVVWRDGKIQCIGGKIVSPDVFEVQFESASLVPSLDLKRRLLGGLLDISGLTITHHKTKAHHLPTPPSPSLPFFSLDLQTHVENGQIALHEETSCQHFTFSITHNVHEAQASGTLVLDWDEATPPLLVTFSSKEEGEVDLEAVFDGQACDELYALVTYFFQEKLPEPIIHWHIRGGSVEGQIALGLSGGEPVSLTGELELLSLDAENRLLALIGEIDQCHASIDADFTNSAELNGCFVLKGGRLALQESREIWQGMWDLRDLSTTICVQEGRVERSVLRGNFMGMGGELTLDWHSPDVLMRMGFEGYSCELFPETCAHDHFALRATLCRAGKGLELEGVLTITDTEAYHLDFGCLFGLGLKEVPPSVTLFDELKKQFCLSQKRFGWFRGENFPIEKFFAPFLIGDLDMELTGRTTFEGTFDERYLVFTYEGRDVHLDTPAYALDVQDIDEPAVHYIDLRSWEHVGVLPLENAHYWQKNRDLHFTQACGTVHFENKTLHIDEITTKWEELALGGRLELNFPARDDVHLELLATHLEGPVEAAQHLLSHFSSSVFWEIPFEGEVSGEGEVFALHYHFHPKAELISGKVEGDFTGTIKNTPLFGTTHISYDFDQIALSVSSSHGDFSATIGEAIALQGESIHLDATRDEMGIEIASFAYGAWEGAGRVNFTEEGAEISHLELRDDQGRGVVLSGLYDRTYKSMHGAVESFAWDFGTSASPLKPEGEILGAGSFTWTGEEGIQAHMAASFKNLQFAGIRFGDGENLSCYYSSKFGFTVEGLEVEIPTDHGLETYKLGRFSYDTHDNKLLFEGFDFSLPPEKLPWITELAGTLFPGKIHPTLVELTAALKQNEPLEGRVSLEVYPDNVWVYLTLNDGPYYLSGRQLELKNFLLLYDPLELGIWTQLRYQDDDYWLHVSTDSMTMSHGRLEISERQLSPMNRGGYDTLVAIWERQADKGWCVRSVEGSFHGIDMALTAPAAMDFSDQITLDGRIGFDLEKASPLLNPDLKALFSRLALKGGYALEGRLTLNKEDFSLPIFEGVLTGSDFHISGVDLSTCSADFIYTPHYIAFSNLSVKDWAGRLSIGHAHLLRTHSGWGLEVDDLQLEETRLSRLRSPWTNWTARDKPFFRSFYITDFALDLVGDLTRLETLQGGGHLTFTNLPKKTLFSNLLFIPSEITARIGLDLTALIPVRGTIDYSIGEGRVYLNAFNEMYSDGKHSRFYLAEGKQAFLDFDGNINMQIKMKQYNLLMKLAEFFTVTVKGTVLNPTYTFTNQDD